MFDRSGMVREIIVATTVIMWNIVQRFIYLNPVLVESDFQPMMTLHKSQ